MSHYIIKSIKVVPNDDQAESPAAIKVTAKCSNDDAGYFDTLYPITDEASTTDFIKSLVQEGDLLASASSSKLGKLIATASAYYNQQCRRWSEDERLLAVADDADIYSYILVDAILDNDWAYRKLYADIYSELLRQQHRVIARSRIGQAA